ncbi:MAG: tetratricopeptide repeat protein [Desulfuromonadales bacterium]
MFSKLSSNPIIHLSVILLLGTLAYANSFSAPFVLDDLESIAQNEIIRDLGNYFPGGSGYDFIFRRWFGYFTFALNYHFGGLDVTGYHLFNLVVHLCNALLVYALVHLTFRTPKLAGSGLAGRSGTVALLAALFFVAHPVQTQAVTYIVQRLTSLCTLFYLLALLLYLAARLRLDKPSPQLGIRQGLSAGGWRGYLLLAGSLATTLLAMYTKEIAFTLPLAMVLYEYSFFRGHWQRRLLFLLPLLLTLPLIPYGVLLSGSGSPLENAGADLEQQFRAHTDMPRLHYLFTQFRVIVTYLRLLFLPVGQNVDYDYPVYGTFFTPPVLLSLLLLAALFALAAYCYWRTNPVSPDPMVDGSRGRDYRSLPTSSSSQQPAVETRLVGFGILWLFLTLAVESSFVPLADVIFEHRLYLPSIGFFWAVAVLILLAAQKSAQLFDGRIPLLISAVIILALATATWQRNQVWENPRSLWEDTVKKSPGKARPWYNLGTYLMDAGQLDKAALPLAQSVINDPEYAEAWHNLGLVQLMTGHYQQALNPLQQAVRLRPEMDNAVINLAIALIQTQQPAAAVARLEPLREKLPERPDVRYNLGLAYLGSGNLSAARGELAVLKSLSPDMAAALAEEIRRTSPVHQ